MPDLLAELGKRIKAVKETSGQTATTLERDLKGIEARLARRYEAIEVGAIDSNGDSLSASRPSRRRSPGNAGRPCGTTVSIFFRTAR